MKVLSFVVIGIVIWGLSWIWPQVNGLLTPPITIGIVSGLGAAAFAYTLIQRFNNDHCNAGSSQDHTSRPMPITAIR
jgi:type IV secretory pathway VirB2 component (pilin)